MHRNRPLWHGASAMHALLVLFALLAPAALFPAAAQMAAVRADDWATAELQAARHPDPVAVKLVRFYRMLAGAAPAVEIAQFRRENPDWPMQDVLTRRWEEASAAIIDDKAALHAFGNTALRTDAGRIRLADALDRTADSRATHAIRAAWIEAGGDAERAFLDRHAARLTPDTHWDRFRALAWAGATQAATRQAARLDPARKPAAEIWLALRDNDPDAPARRAALPAALRDDPLLVLEHARLLRRTNRDTEAATLLIAAGTAAQEATPSARLSGFWSERHLLARRLLRWGEAQTAYRLVAGHGQPDGAAALDAEFLAGWIALRRLNDPASAEAHFTRLAAMSQAAITQGRAMYWLGRAAAARGDAAAARERHQAGAAWMTTYYGQLAALALGESDADLAARIRGARDPRADEARLAEFAGRELTRAAALLLDWGEPRRARFFLLRISEVAADPVDRALAARLAAGMGRPELGVWVARRAAVSGTMLPDTGWPMPFDPPAEPVEPALAHAIMRQESNFEPDAISPAGARGLMQLMPGTARMVARRIPETTSPARLLNDTDHNMRLGTLYLRQVLDDADGCLPCAAAAYNAGPRRLREWLEDHGDPRMGQIDMIDWIELIPFNETRNYVQRVTENVVIYRAKRGEARPHPLAPWLR